VPTSQLSLRARCHCQGGLASPRPCRVPPAPNVLTSLYMEYLRENKQRSAETKLSFIDYQASIGFTDPSVSVVGMDDRVLAEPAVGDGVQLLAIPKKGVQGTLRVMVLLGNRSLSGVLLPPGLTRNNPSQVHQGGGGSDQGDSQQQQVAAA
jgi:hypothetical protein